MYYYANIDDTGLCCDLLQSETPIDDPYYIQIDSYDRTYMLRKRYIDGVWTDTTVEEVAEMAMIGEQVAMFGENKWLEDVLDEKAPLEHTHTGYASSDHTHTGYVSADDLQALEDVVDTKADANHTHTGYADVNHSHDEYVLQTSLDTLGEEIDGKADAVHSHSEYALTSHEHSNYAEIGHDHNSDYAPISHNHTDYVTTTDFNSLESEVDGKASVSHTHTASEIGAATSGHNHDSDYSNINHNHDSAYALSEHDHDEDYSAIDHVHSNYATVTSLSELSSVVSGKADSSHNHDDVYYTETEIDSKLATKSDTSHNHTGVYDVNGAAASALSSANAYTDSKIDALVGEGAATTLDTIGEISAAITDNQDAIDLLNSAIANKANVVDLNSHASDTEIHITNAERNAWNAKSDFSGNYNDLTNKPTIPSINGLATETYVDTQIDAIDIPSALSDLTTDSTHRVVTDAEKAAWNAKSNFSGSYNDLTNKPSIPSISGLATETYVDEAVSAKANSSHSHTIANVSGLQSALDAKSDSTHNHNASYDALGAANSALTSAQTYTDEAIDALSETVSTKADASTLTSHTDNTTIHITGAERTNWNAAKTHADSAHAPTTNATQTASGLMSKADKIKLDGIAEGANNYTLPSAGTSLGGVKSGGDVTISGGVITVNDDSHNHVISNVDGLQSALDSKAASGHNHDDAYYTESEVDTLLSGKANSSHTHTIANITNLQSTLDGKAATSHGTHVSYSTTAPVMDGSASVGTASTVARSDHKHPTDTSRAAQTSLDSHTGNKSNPHGVTLAQLGLTAMAAELNYVDGVTSAIQTQLDGKAASGHTHGAATTSTSGFMTKDMVTKLNGIATGANAYTHPTYTARTGVPTANQTPAFGGTFTVSQPVSDGTGHITAVNNRTITIPSAVATTSANGLMSASDKSKLDGMVVATVSEVETYLGI